MASEAPSPPSRYPPSMGPGGRPNQPGSRQTKLSAIIEARSKYQINVEPEILQLSYERNDTPQIYRLPFESLPLGGFSKWYLYGSARRARSAGVLAIDLMRVAENALERPVTQPEAEAIAYHTGRDLMYHNLAAWCGAGVGGIIAWRTRGNMKFPFIKAKPLERYNRFPAENMPLLQGRYAQGAWQMTRVNIWMAFCLLTVGPFLSAVSSVATAPRLLTDQRTKDIIKAMREKGQRSIEALAEASGEGQSQDRPQPLSQRSGQDGIDVESNSPAFYQESDQVTSDDPRYADDGSFRSGASDGGSLNDFSMRGGDTRQTTAMTRGEPAYGESTRRPQPEPVRERASGDSDPFFYDDASPTAGNDPDMTTPTRYNRPMGSVWERIRRDGASPSERGQSTDPGPGFDRSRGGAESGGQFDGSGTTEMSGGRDGYRGSSSSPRQGRERAQRAFDEMLERERQGSGSDEYDRGMQAVESGQEDANPKESMSAWERRRGN